MRTMYFHENIINGRRRGRRGGLDLDPRPRSKSTGVYSWFVYMRTCGLGNVCLDKIKLNCLEVYVRLWWDLHYLWMSEYKLSSWYV